ncbi:MAG: Mrp/NBP35 family ATP-binding protein [Bacteroidota bacterium]|nr:Mrp/NBP35 family ATP-binding protein [Bacteroidota bacterium]
MILDNILNVLKKIKDPESGKDIISLKAVKSLEKSDAGISFKLEFAKTNPFLNSIKKASEKLLKEEFGENISVNIITTEPRKIETQKISIGRTDEGTTLPQTKNIIAVASGKGGVGKSTVAANLAVALSKKGAKVGLLDADIYGPSQIKMFGVEGVRPEITKKDGKDQIIPVEAHGIKMLSIGFFVKETDALIWRGPMATGAIKQLINDADWGELDYMIVDLPPGTGDIHLTMVQTVPITGAIIVSTPQEVALIDAQRGVSMFQAEKIEVPVLGFVENMSWFTPKELPDNKYYIFGKDGLKKLAEKDGIPLLGQIPIVQSIREDGDNGRPSALEDDTTISIAFNKLADNVTKIVEERNKTLDPTKVVEIDPNASC